jgi:hypothetical protein
MNRRTLTVTAAAAATLLLPAPAAPASDDDVRRAGSCTGSSSSKIKAKPDDGGLEVEFEVDQNVNGVKWKVRLKDNGDVVFRGGRRTKAPSGSFSVERRIANEPGTDEIKGIGRDPASGERCVAKVRI